MSNRIEILKTKAVDDVFRNYPEHVRPKIINLRRIILEVAQSIETVTQIEETLKWGEPSYITKQGSTVRIDWKPKSPEQYAIYFKCTSRLVDTFITLYPHLFRFEGTRAIIFNLDEEIPEPELRKCIKAALTYHKVKQLPTLGIN